MKTMRRALICLYFCAAGGLGLSPALAQTIIINEVHYHPGDGGSSGEFVELHNYGSRDVDISGWLLSGAVTYAFPQGSVIEADGFLVIAENAELLASRYGLERGSLEGDYTGNLDNAGELLQLWTPVGYMVSFVDYGESDLWPETPDGLGPSLERLSPTLEETDPRAWAASIPVGGTPGAANSVRITDVNAPERNRSELIAQGAEFRFFRGTEPPPEDWKELDFDDGEWESGPAGFGYGDDDDATVLEDMSGNYLTVFLRRRFDVDDLDLVEELLLSVDYDDGFVAYINGEEIARANLDATEFDSPTIINHEAGASEEFPVDNLDLLREGENVLAVQGHNTGLESSDFSISPFLEFIEAEEGKKPEDDPEPPERDLVINEVYTGGEGSGWVELYNPTGEEVNAGGRRVGLFPPESGSFTLPAQTSIGAGGRMVLFESQLGFELDRIQALILDDGRGRFIDGFNPRAAGASASTGRFPDGADNRVVFEETTPSTANRYVPRRDIVINEIMYHPPDDAGGEYLELLNRSGEMVDLGGWSFTRGIDYTFAAGTTLGPGEYLVLAREPAAVEEHYDIDGVLGPWEGALDNAAETLLLRGANGNMVDRVRYADEGSYPEEADGDGPSLELINPGIENRYGPAWRASEEEGSPGRFNSRSQPDPEPIIVGVRHEPVIPTADQGVRVLAVVSDDQPLQNVTLPWEVDDADDSRDSTEMVDDGEGDDGIAGNGVYGADIPAQSNLDVIAFWIDAEGEGDQSTRAPADAPDRPYLYQVESSPAAEIRPLYRIIMRGATLRNFRNRARGSDDLANMTLVADGRAWHNRGIRLRGSSARNCNPLSYRIQFDHASDFHGIKRINMNGCNSDQQWLGLDFLRRTGTATPLAWFRRLSFNRQLDQGWHLRVEVIRQDFLERTFPNDADGNLYRGIGQANLDYRGETADRYRQNYRKDTNRDEDDYSDVADLCRDFDAAETSDADFPEAIEQRIDVLQWSKYFATYAMLGSTENSIVLNNGDDYFLYHRFSDDRWILLPWDLDSCFDQANQELFRPTVDQIERFLEHPRYAPDYLCYIATFLETAWGDEQVDVRIDQLEPLFANARINRLRDYADQRRTFLRERIDTRFEITSIRGGAICDGVLFPNRPIVTIEGVAPSCGSADIFIGETRAVFDYRAGTWSANIEILEAGVLEIVARDRTGFERARIDLPTDAPPQDDGAKAPNPGNQAPEADYIAMLSTDYAEITDPDEDNITWLFTEGVDNSLSPDARVLTAPNDGDFRSQRQSSAIYRLHFLQSGTYRAYFRIRGFDRNSNSLWRPRGFGLDPDINMNTGNGGRFSWISEGDYVVTQEDVDEQRTLEFLLGVREFRAQVDAFVLSLDADLVGPDLNGLFGEGPAGAPVARPLVNLVPAAEVALEEGSVEITFDAQRSHDGACGRENLEFDWEKISGPEGAAFAGPVNLSVLSVVFTQPGEYLYRLTVSTTDLPESARSRDFSITVTDGAGPDTTPFLRCDSNANGENSLADAVFTLRHLFGGESETRCEAAMDCDSDGEISLSDAVFNLNYLFLGGRIPAAPFPACATGTPENCALSNCQN